MFKFPKCSKCYNTFSNKIFIINQPSLVKLALRVGKALKKWVFF